MSEDKKQRLRSAAGSSLPIASVIDDSEIFKRVVKLLKEATSTVVRRSECEDREREIKEELGAICAAYDLKGFRHGKHGFEYHGYMTRKTLSKERLLAQGVSAEQIDAAYEDGKPYLYAKIIPFDLD